MNLRFSSTPFKNQNYRYPCVKTISILWIMSALSVQRLSSRCSGFRFGSVGNRRRATRVETLWKRRNTNHYIPSKALFATASGDVKDKESSILYQQFKDLSIEIRRHDELYYGNGTNSASEERLLSDDEFDALVRKEEELETKFPELLKMWQDESGLGLSATRSGRVGAKSVTTSTTERLKRRHLAPMLSLDNVHNEDQLLVWLKRVVKAVDAQAQGKPSTTNTVTIVTEPKLDGVSMSLRYESIVESSNNAGKIPLQLKWASTRGDGSVGQDVTAAAKQMTGIPNIISLSNENKKLESNIVLEVRGEVVLPRSEFLKLQDQAQEATTEQEKSNHTSENSIVSFANPRNAASGIMLRKESEDPEEKASSKQLRSLLRFYAYDLSGLEEEQGAGQPSEMDGIEIREQLEDWGFSLALPIAMTNLEWKTNPMEDIETETESAAEAKSVWEEWFREDIASHQIEPILEYFAALEEHREQLPEDDGTNSTLSTTSSKTKANKNFDWGDFDMDGCVHKVTQATIRSSMGYTTKSPKWATAHKFPAQSSVARLLDIIVQVGRTGAITPVAVLEPTEVGGVTVQRATLHNFGHLQEIMGFESNQDLEKGLALIPKYEPLLVQRAGDVIPQVVRRIKSHSEPIEEELSTTEWISLDPPDKCPYCSSPVAYDTLAQSSSSSAVGQVVRCSGPPLLCPPRAVTSLKHAFSRDAMDLTGLSEARIQQLMDADLLKFPSDIFTLGDEEWKTLEALPGWGTKSCQNLQDASQKVASRGISLGRFIYSLGIRHVGKHTSELVASCYGSVGAFLEALDAASNQEWTIGDETQSHQPFPELENKLGIGPVAIDSLIAFSKSKELVDASKTLAESLTILEQDIVLEENDETLTFSDGNQQPWKGFRVVFTGSLSQGLTRSRAQEIAKQLGAKATPGSVSKSTDLVVFGDKGGKKLSQARDLGIATITAEDFVKLADEHGLLDVDDR